MPQKDNQTLRRKVSLRRAALAELSAPPVILETHGGKGRLYLDCYTSCTTGLVIEKETEKCDILARQRPSWRVYQGDCERLLTAGAGADLSVNLLDVDPYGEAISAIRGFFAPDRAWAPELHIVVNDGGRLTAKREVAYRCGALRDAVARWGNNLYFVYLDVCKALLEEAAAQAGYELTAWAGYYATPDVTHYRAVLRR